MFFRRLNGKCQMKRKLILEKLENRTLLSTGVLQIDNVLGSYLLNNSFMAKHLPGGMEGIDSFDTSVAFGPEGSGAYTTIESYDLRTDTRDVSSVTPFNTNLVYNGTITQPTENHLEVSLPYSGSGYDFGTTPITLQEDNGQRNDVRQAIAAGEIAPGIGKISLDNVLAGASGTYATPTVHFKNKADLSNDGKVDMVDFALLGQNWLNYEGMPGATGDYLLGDITGAEGKPDGSVNLADLTEFSKQWMDVQPPAE